MTLEKVRKTYEDLGREDPMWAVLTDDRYRHNKWNPEEFFGTGRKEIAAVFDHLQGLNLSIPGGRALDFGCGVGRLSQALGERFESVVGVDISSTMVERAEAYNRHGERCRYVVNTRDDLTLFEQASFDFIYSSITLQHVPPEYQLRYIAEFFRLLRPGGLAVFQIRSGPLYAPGSLGSRLYKLRTEFLRPYWKKLRGRPMVQVHTVAPSLVEETIESAGGMQIDVACVDKQHRRIGASLRYCAERLAKS
jgi:ubiquinone/menaquinone biosynthesis C-methylase UbiE